MAAKLVSAFVQAQRVGWERLQRPGALGIILPWLTAENRSNDRAHGRQSLEARIYSELPDP
jgi:hypothetical protein